MPLAPIVERVRPLTPSASLLVGFLHLQGSHSYSFCTFLAAPPGAIAVENQYISGAALALSDRNLLHLHATYTWLCFYFYTWHAFLLVERRPPIGPTNRSDRSGQCPTGPTGPTGPTARAQRCNAPLPSTCTSGTRRSSSCGASSSRRTNTSTPHVLPSPVLSRVR